MIIWDNYILLPIFTNIPLILVLVVLKSGIELADFILRNEIINDEVKKFQFSSQVTIFFQKYIFFSKSIVLNFLFLLDSFLYFFDECVEFVGFYIDLFLDTIVFLFYVNLGSLLLGQLFFQTTLYLFFFFQVKTHSLQLTFLDHRLLFQLASL